MRIDNEYTGIELPARHRTIGRSKENHANFETLDPDRYRRHRRLSGPDLDLERLLAPRPARQMGVAPPEINV